jgi:hypothetical protein
MKISNDLKRVRKKLKLFDQEALNWVLSDLLGKIDHNMSQKTKDFWIMALKVKYQAEAHQLTPPDPKQSKLFE